MVSDDNCFLGGEFCPAETDHCVVAPIAYQRLFPVRKKYYISEFAVSEIYLKRKREAFGVDIVENVGEDRVVVGEYGQTCKSHDPFRGGFIKTQGKCSSVSGCAFWMGEKSGHGGCRRRVAVVDDRYGNAGRFLSNNGQIFFFHYSYCRGRRRSGRCWTGIVQRFRNGHRQQQLDADNLRDRSSPPSRRHSRTPK